MSPNKYGLPADLGASRYSSLATAAGARPTSSTNRLEAGDFVAAPVPGNAPAGWDTLPAEVFAADGRVFFAAPWATAAAVFAANSCNVVREISRATSVAGSTLVVMLEIGVKPSGNAFIKNLRSADAGQDSLGISSAGTEMNSVMSAAAADATRLVRHRGNAVAIAVTATAMARSCACSHNMSKTALAVGHSSGGSWAKTAARLFAHVVRSKNRPERASCPRALEVKTVVDGKEC